MGKKFVIMEVKEIGNSPDGGYEPLDSYSDPTWIHHRHVIDGNRLGYDTPKKGMTFFDFQHGWSICEKDTFASYDPRLILNPPKEDKFEKWLAACPLDQWQSEMREKLAEWILSAPRKS